MWQLYAEGLVAQDQLPGWKTTPFFGSVHLLSVFSSVPYVQRLPAQSAVWVRLCGVAGEIIISKHHERVRHAVGTKKMIINKLDEGAALRP
jgi:hypothetical protein